MPEVFCDLSARDIVIFLCVNDSVECGRNTYSLLVPLTYVFDNGSMAWTFSTALRSTATMTSTPTPTPTPASTPASAFAPAATFASTPASTAAPFFFFLFFLFILFVVRTNISCRQTCQNLLSLSIRQTSSRTRKNSIAFPPGSRNPLTYCFSEKIRFEICDFSGNQTADFGVPLLDRGEPDLPLLDLDLGDLEGDFPLLDLGDLETDFPLLDLGDLEADFPLLDLGDLEADFPLLDLGDLEADFSLLDLGDLEAADFSLRTEPTLERLEPDPAGDGDRLSDLRLPSSLFDPTGLRLVDLEARLPLAFDAGEAGAPFSSSECSLLTLLDVRTGACDARLPLRLDLEDADALSDSEPEKHNREIRAPSVVMSIVFSSNQNNLEIPTSQYMPAVLSNIVLGSFEQNSENVCHLWHNFVAF
ncbi:hypothetical protein DBV15_05815 [Temnothorax longispinosus]|uniref:Uncharacterized protein n=1 Tax=Temnothorax longispinosus TaxID=300112 RepID=A0A4S2JLR8_9HYME|nr:hypothetical protein DBV15_05815 [Temnothorax longispinosus]